MQHCRPPRCSAGRSSPYTSRLRRRCRSRYSSTRWPLPRARRSRAHRWNNCVARLPPSPCPCAFARPRRRFRATRRCTRCARERRMCIRSRWRSPCRRPRSSAYRKYPRGSQRPASNACQRFRLDSRRRWSSASPRLQLEQRHGLTWEARPGRRRWRGRQSPQSPEIGHEARRRRRRPGPQGLTHILRRLTHPRCTASPDLRSEPHHPRLTHRLGCRFPLLRPCARCRWCSERRARPARQPPPRREATPRRRLPP